MATPKLKQIKGGAYAVKWARATVEFDILKKTENIDGKTHPIIRVRVGRRRAIYTVTDQS